jgi:hypothetical protein
MHTHEEGRAIDEGAARNWDQLGGQIYSDRNESLHERQASKIARLYFLANATARTVAALAFAGGQR